jgi:hypothetical protein
MTRRLFMPVALLLLTGPALADCTDDVCVSLQKILAARSGNFAKLKGKATVDTRGDAVWQGTQPIGSLINACYVYKRGEGSRYEYRCDSSGFGARPPQSAEKAKQIAADVKTAFQAADPAVVWLKTQPLARSPTSKDLKVPRAGTGATPRTRPWWYGWRPLFPAPPAMRPSLRYLQSRWRGAI